MLSKLRIGPKLLLAPGLVLILLIAVSSAAYYGLVLQNRSLDYIVQQRAARLKSVAELTGVVNRAHTDVYQLLTWLSASFSTPRVEAQVRAIQSRHALIDHQFNQLELATPAGGPERRYLEQSQAAQQLYDRAITEVIELALADPSMATNAMSKAERAFDVVALRLGQLSRLEQDMVDQSYRAAGLEFDRLSLWLPVVVALSIALSLLVTMRVRQTMLAEVDAIGAAARGLGQGNLTVPERVYGNDEIADTSRALDSSIRNLNAALSTILSSAQSIDSAARDLVCGSAGMLAGNRVQRGTLERGAGSMQALGAAVHESAGHARLASQLAVCAGDFAVRGGSVVQKLVVTMESLRGSSRKVAEVAGVIDGIALRSHLLARDAAAEALRAGAHGLGFAALAGDAQTLARSSASAAQQIKGVIAESEAQLAQGHRTVRETGCRIAEIVESVRRVDSLAGLIDQTCERQAQGVSDLSLAILHMDQMTAHSSGLVTQAAAAAASLQHQALTLSQAVAGFQLDEAAPARGEPDGAAKKNAGERAARLRLASNRG